jgi:hypothetical protein
MTGNPTGMANPWLAQDELWELIEPNSISTPRTIIKPWPRLVRNRHAKTITIYSWRADTAARKVASALGCVEPRTVRSTVFSTSKEKPVKMCTRISARTK